MKFLFMISALLALTIGYRDNASELLKDSSAPISRALTTDSEEAKAKVNTYTYIYKFFLL